MAGQICDAVFIGWQKNFSPIQLFEFFPVFFMSITFELIDYAFNISDGRIKMEV